MSLLKNKFPFLVVILLFESCSNNGSNQLTADKVEEKKPCLYCIYNQDEQVSLVNEKGETIAPYGKFDFCFFDSTYTFGTVYDPVKKGFFAYDVSGKELFQVMQFDNGPDYVEDGLFRIVKDSLIGYADENGEIVIEPQFQCAYPFEDGKAQVSKNCKKSIEFEMEKWESNEWYFIDKKGKIVN